MSAFIAALPMYDWPEVSAETDGRWALIRDQLRERGIDAPERLTRRNGDMPAVPGGIRGADDRLVAPDPATLPPDQFDLATLWRHPALIFGQTCWGPMQCGLEPEVLVVHQPDYSRVEGGSGEFYSSAIIVRRGERSRPAAPPADGSALLPFDRMRGRRLAFNNPDSMSGLIALAGDLEAVGQSLAIFSDRVETGAHRASVVAVAEGSADIATIDCRSWELARRFMPEAREVEVVGWTARRKGLPYIMARPLAALLPQLRQALAASGAAAIHG
jgi:ABC-type phosphate/phosphonate transport system substrate-binding protein